MVVQVLETAKHFLLVFDEKIACPGSYVSIGSARAKALWPTGGLTATSVGVLKRDLPGEDKETLVGRNVAIET